MGKKRKQCRACKNSWRHKNLTHSESLQIFVSVDVFEGWLDVSLKR